MTTIEVSHRPKFGKSCAQCGDPLVAPEWSEYVSERHVRHLWSCMSCGYQFETSVYLRADATSKTFDRDRLLPVSLVA